jgi:hypothetical protein
VQSIVRHSLFLFRRHWPLLLATWLIGAVIAMFVMYLTDILVQGVAGFQMAENALSGKGFAMPKWVYVVRGIESMFFLSVICTTSVRAVTHPNELGEVARRMGYRAVPRVMVLGLIFLAPGITAILSTDAPAIVPALIMTVGVWGFLLSVVPMAMGETTWGVDDAASVVTEAWLAVVPALVAMTVLVGGTLIATNMVGMWLMGLAWFPLSMLMLCTAIAAYQHVNGEPADAFVSSPHVETNVLPQLGATPPEQIIARGEFTCEAPSGGAGGAWVELPSAGIFELTATWDSTTQVKVDLALPDGRWFGLPTGLGQPVVRKLQLTAGQYYLGTWQESANAAPISVAISWRLIADEPEQLAS